MKNRLYIIAAVAILAAVPVRAQFNETNNLFYHTLRTPQSNLLNAAFFPTNNTFYLALPGLDFQFGSPLMLGEVVHYDKPTRTTIIDLDTIFNSLRDNNTFRIGANVNLLGFGFKIHHTFVTFNTRLVNNLAVSVPIQTIDALRRGNLDENGNPISVVEVMKGDLLNFTSYMEAGLGVGHRFAPIGLTVGVRAKLLYGIANIQTDNTRITIETDPNMDSVTARMYYELQAATAVPYDTNNKKFQFNMGDLFKIGQANTGLSFDLGLKYDLGPLTLSFAINDLSSGIHWKNNVMTYKPKNGEGDIVFRGLNLGDMLNNGSLNLDSLTTYLKERLENMKYEQTLHGDYWYSIPTKVNLGASLSFAKLLRAGFLFHGQWDRGLISKKNTLTVGSELENTFRWNATFTLGANLFNWFEIIAGNSIVNDGEKIDLINPGVGFVFSLGTVMQFYFMTDYISSIYFTESASLNLKLGLNVLIGKGGRSLISSL